MTDHGFDVEARLSDLDRRGLRRALSPVDRVSTRGRFAPPPGGDLPVLDAEERLVFGSNNYLGLADDPRVVGAARAAVETVGAGAGASRLATGDTMVHRDLERRLARTTGADRALAFASGYAATAGTVAALSPDVVFVDERERAAVVDGCRISGADVVAYDHCDAEDLHERMARRDGSGSWLVATRSTFGTDGTVAPLAELQAAAATHGAWTMVDETHAVGLHAGGGGVVEREGIGDRVDVRTGSLAAALASQGGYVAGSEPLVEYLVNRAPPFFLSAGLAPPAAAAAAEALHVSRHGDVREYLWDNVDRLREGLVAAGYDVGGDAQVLAVDVGNHGSADQLAARAYDRGVVVPAVGPPLATEATGLVRVTPMAAHDEDDVDRCVEALAAAGREVGIL